MKLITTVGLALTLFAAQPPVRQPPRDNRTPAWTPGTAVISGVVVTSDTPPRPVRRARVAINSSEFGRGQTTITGDDGRFAFTAVPAGRFSLTAAKAGYVNAAYKATRPGQAGTPLTVGDGQQITDVVLTMARGSVITGIVSDEFGQPAAGVVVRALTYRTAGGERRLVPFFSGNATSQVTDDRGRYRLYGLPADEYVIAASPSGPALRGLDMQLMTPDDIGAALQELQLPATQARPGAAGAVPASVATPSSRPRTVGYTSVYYPGTVDTSQAATVAIGTGEERGGIDFALQMVGTSRIEGVVLAPEGVSVQGVAVTLIASGVPVTGIDRIKLARAGADGRFSFSGVQAGRYTIAAQTAGSANPLAAGRPAGRGGADGGDAYWAMTQLTADGQDVTNLTLTLEPGLTFSGRLRFRGTTLERPSDLTRIRLALSPAQGGEQIMMGSRTNEVAPTGEFTLSGITPGRYRLTASVPGQRPGSGWVLESAIVGGVDIADLPIEIRPGESLTGAVITFMDRPTELTGRLQDASGQPASDYHLVVFPADRKLWTWPSRRIRTARPANDGTFVVRDLPPGEYLIAAAYDVEPGETSDPAFLDRLAPTSMKITLAEGERKVQDIRIAD